MHNVYDCSQSASFVNNFLAALIELLTFVLSASCAQGLGQQVGL